jgi:hypothetical protein
MKLAFILLAFIPFFSGYSQDSIASCIAYWKLGETKIYSIVHEKNTIDSVGKNSTFKFGYEAWVTVIDSAAKSYTIKWVFHLPKQATITPALSDSLPVYNGMSMIFRITNLGGFIELLNWEEVRDSYIRMMELSLPKKMDSTAAAILQSSKNLFHSKEMVESALIQEIQLFQIPYGYKFSIVEATAKTEIPNPFGGDPFPAVQTFKLTELDPKKDEFTLAFDMRIDKGNLKGMIDSLVKKMNIKEGQEMQAAKEQIGSFDLHDFSEYHFIKSSGCIRRLYYKRTTVLAGATRTDAYTITLKDQ